MTEIIEYLASPYSHPDPAVMEQRYQAACRAAGRRIAAGFVTFSPIAHSHVIAKAGGVSGSWDVWERWDLAMLERCDRLVVLMLPGWEKSVGVQAEVDHAKKCGIPVECIEPSWARALEPRDA